MKIDAEKYRKKYPFITRLFRMIKFYFLLFVRKEDSPERIAHGFAVGIFVGYLPIIPFQAIVSILTCTIFKVNRLAGVIGSTTVTNPIMAVPVFYAQHFIGRIFILHDFSYDRFKDLFVKLSMDTLSTAGKDILILFQMVTIGGIVVGILTYPLAYYLAYNTIVKRRKNISIARLLKISLKKAK